MSRYSIDNLPDYWYFPTTRYQGSKRKILAWIWSKVKDLEFDTALDLFGGTGTVSLLFKRMGKKVFFNDYLKYNYNTGIALIENNTTLLNDKDVFYILNNEVAPANGGFIEKTFRNFYFLDEENILLDKIVGNIHSMNRHYRGKKLVEKKALAIWTLGQACLIKRPFNLFHRKNLSLRTKNVNRSFGNKSTWEIPLEKAFMRFAMEINKVVYDNKRKNISKCKDAFSIKENKYDLVYLDPPYFFKNQRDTDYREMYHFLDGLADYSNWDQLIDYNSFNYRLKRNHMQWPAKSAKDLSKLYKILIDKFSDSIIVISHKSGSLVPVGAIKDMLLDKGKKVKMYRKRYYYALSKKNGKPRQNIEWLYVAI